MSANATLCRMCAEIVYDARNIYDNDYDNVQYISKFKQLFSDIVFEEDGYSLPEHICSNCCAKLKDASNFKKQCISSMKYLKKWNTSFQERKPENCNFEHVDIKQEVDLKEELTENSSGNIECDTTTDFVNLGNCTESGKVENCQEFRNKFSEIQKDNNTNYENQKKSKKREKVRKLHCSVLKLKDLYPTVHVPNVLHNLDLDPFVLLTPFTNPNLFHGNQSEKINNDNKSGTTRKVTNKRTNVNSAVQTIESENADVRIANSEEIHTCFKCEKSFRSHSDLEMHVTVHLKHSDENVKVKIEIKEELIESNADRSANQVRYSCKECNKHYSWKHDLKKHVMWVHRGRKPYSCDECQQHFIRKDHLKLHIIKVHGGVKPYSCKECHKQFGRKNDLKRHSMDVHRGIRPYSCNECQKKFAQKSSLEVHMNIHRGVKPYNCKECYKHFSRKSHLKRHMVCVHQGEKNRTVATNATNTSHRKPISINECISSVSN